MKTAILIPVIVLLVLGMSASASSSETNINIWRCGNAVVSIGDRKSSVLLKCGSPTLKDVIEYSTKGTFNSLTLGRKRGKAYKQTKQVKEEWVYNCGDRQFNIYLTFRGGRLISIVRGEYGSGESHCDGADNNPNNEE